MDIPKVTVVVSTYNRASILRSALQSVIYQTFEEWQVFVIGDNCNEETAQMIQELNHPKIKYHNNPLRYGEQSGSNNIGMALASSKYIALLNHDDVWTPDHLEKAVDHLERTNDKLYVANSIFSKRVDQTGFPILKYAYLDRKPKEIFSASHIYVEPSSSWVFDRQLIQCIGYWKHKSEVSRAPIVDYMLRCWRQGVNIHFAEEITCVASAFHHEATTSYAYAYKGRELEELVSYFNAKKQLNQPYIPPRNSLKFIKEKSFLTSKNLFRVRIWPAVLLKNDVTALIYYVLGLDTWAIYLRLRRTRGEMKLSVSRTGESCNITKPQFSEALALAKKNLS